ncbi:MULTISPECIES: alpha/beta hydrolase [unclassified Herbaspirillum]|uniref:alpha/beta hydrolase n=1 Tax=unclassified Herbaspirillum TaxID=2624150 RepID=UPI001152BBE4|nr:MULTISPECIES: alpha/beta hydrolase [unclassified Herbaspirillum]MBB5390723.1 arylformamidase [Herbaspirillum sp. SJZ102]TQK08792.1 arylformamidase [Herbaspirillum sp. SJZ130]TQK14521.1 arylformamidase [Herbaspirillum sp. SJZ106]
MNIYREYTRDALDRQYNVRLDITDFQDYFDRFAQQALAARQAHPHLADVPYGKDPLQTFDFFPASDNGRPLLLFIHGGYWRSLDKNLFSHLALPYLQADINVALINYRLAPQVRMDAIAADCATALKQLHAKAGALGFDADAIWLMGHSAGGHLAALIGALGPTPVRGVCGISGIYDLEPIQLSYLNELLHLSPDNAVQASPLRLLPPPGVKTLLCAGGLESDEFRRQRDTYAACLRQSAHEATIAEAPGAHHLSIIDVAADAGSELTRAMLAMIRAG